MKQLIVLLVILIVVIGGCSLFYFYFIHKIKVENRLLGKHIDRLTTKYKAEGLDRYYQGLKTTELIRAHKNTVDAYDRYVDDMEKAAELNCRENFILAALAARGVDTEALVKKHLGQEQLSKSTFDRNVKIVSVEMSTIFILMFFEILALAIAALSLTYTYVILKTTDWNRHLLFSQEFLIMLALFALSLFSAHGTFEAFKANTYVLKLEEREFIYKFISERTIPYDAIHKLLFVSRVNTWERDYHELRIILNDGKTIRLRVDHLYFYKAAEIIRPKDKRYLDSPGDEDLIWEFFTRKTGKPIEGKY